MRLTLNIEEAMRNELVAAQKSTGVKDTDLVRIFIGSGLDAIKSGEGVTAKARWGKPARSSLATDNASTAPTRRKAKRKGAAAV